MIVSVDYIKFWILNYQREHSKKPPTSTQLQIYINDSNDTDVKRVYSRIEISKILSNAVRQGVLYKIREGKKLFWGIRAEVMPRRRPIVKDIKVWDGSLPDFNEREKEEIWQPDKPEKSKTFWDGSKEDIWEIEEIK